MQGQGCPGGWHARAGGREDQGHKLTGAEPTHLPLALSPILEMFIPHERADPANQVSPPYLPPEQPINCLPCRSAARSPHSTAILSLLLLLLGRSPWLSNASCAKFTSRSSASNPPGIYHCPPSLGILLSCCSHLRSNLCIPMLLSLFNV